MTSQEMLHWIEKVEKTACKLDRLADEAPSGKAGSLSYFLHRAAEQAREAPDSTAFASILAAQVREERG